MAFAVVIIVVAGFFVVSRVFAATVTVCSSGCDQTTIGGAITAATSGDTITVAAGTYTENVVISKTNLTIQGTGSPTINPASGHAVEITAPGAKIDGFTISPQGSTSNAAMGVIVNAGGGTTGVTISNDTITTVAGTLYLIGIARGQAELDLVTAHASDIAYVRRLVSHVVMIDDPIRLPNVED